MNESGADEAECRRKVAGAIRSLVNAWSLWLECARVLHESLLVPIPMYVSKTMIWREKDRSRIRDVQMDNLRGLLGIRRMNKVPNSWIRQLCGVMKVFSDGSAMWKERRMTGLLKGSM